METPRNPDPARCPGIAEIREVLAGDLTTDPKPELIRHLDSCPKCQAVMDELLGPASLHRLASAETTAMPDFQGGRETGSAQFAEIPGYRILETVGHGGEGIVYKAIDTASGETVALKRLAFAPFGETGNEGREIEAARKLDHPGIVRLLNQFEWNGHTVLAMEWVEGGTLKEFLERNPVSQDEAVRLAIRLCEILEYAHDRGLIHRDLKPANVLLENGRVEHPRLADFGLAKFAGPEGKYSAVTSGLGTPGYMPPEMVSTHFGPVGPATDIYALGVMLYEMLVRRLPFESDTPFDILRRTCDEPVTSLRRWKPEIPRDLENVCLQCLAKRPQDRYRNVTELKNDLARHSKGEPVLARRAGAIDQLKGWARRNPAVAFSLSGAFLILVTSVIVLSILLERTRQKLAAESSLKLAVDSMKNAAPIYKRFTQNTLPSDAEISNLAETAKLCLRIGDDTTDLKTRCDSYFNALQMGTALRAFPAQLDLAESIFRSTLDQFLDLKANHESALRKTLRTGSLEGDYVSELDMVNIRIGYSLIEMANVQHIREPQQLKLYDTYVDQAIAQCELTLRENPSLEEALSMLGSFLTMRTDRLFREGKSEEALALIRKSLDYHKAFHLLEPANTIRWSFYVKGWGNYLRGLEKQNPGSAEFRKAIEARFGEFRDLYSRRPQNWAAQVVTMLDALGHFFIYEANRYDNVSLLDRCDEILNVLDELRASKGPDFQQRLIINSIWTEIISQFVLAGLETRARDESRRMEKWLLSLERSKETDYLVCYFRMLSPLKEFRSTPEAVNLAAGFSGDDKTTGSLKEWTEIANGGPIPADIGNPGELDGVAALHRWASCHLFSLERLKPAEWSEENRRILAEVKRILANELEIATTWRVRCRELEAAAQANAQASRKAS